MQIPFEQWILTRNISNGVKQLMEEAFTCYNASPIGPPSCSPILVFKQY